MAAIALPRPIAPHRPATPIGSVASPITIDSITSQPGQCPPAVSNKHIPVCPPGPTPCHEPTSPPPICDDRGLVQPSLLYPPDSYPRIDCGSLSLYHIQATEVAVALDYLSRQPLPDPSRVFPWFHGLHPSNQIQQTFFNPRRRSPRRTPSCLRGITVVKADGNLSVSRLKGAVAPDEFLQSGHQPEFLDVDPRKGFSSRNFQIQAAKSAMTSDIVIYGDDDSLVRKLGWDIAAAQQKWRQKHESQGHPLPEYNTFLCVSPFAEFEQTCPEIVAIDSTGSLTGNVVDLLYQERKEMYAMTKASEISHNVWLGPTPDPAFEDDLRYDLLIDCNESGRLNPAALRRLAIRSAQVVGPVCFEFPSSGNILAPTWSQAEADEILDTCKWIFHLAHGIYPFDEAVEELFDELDSPTLESSGACQTGRRPLKILIHCTDGYTESALLGIAYFSYCTGLPIPDAWLKLHTEKRRNFFAYPTDVALLSAIAPRLLHESPACAGRTTSEIAALVNDEPSWFAALDGSLPSRIADYMYLGNLTHANNPGLLKALGIGQLLSVGETASWPDGQLEEWGSDNVCIVQGVQDNGIDSLTGDFERCLGFIDRGRCNGTATLVHCRVGVSRSATICIAEVMRSMGMSLPRAYCFVRARRLNVIIQPHLRFAYELLKWEELLRMRNAGRGNGSPAACTKRELEWGEIAREVALMNRPYAH